MSPAQDIRQYLVDEGIGADAGETDFALYFGEEPPKPANVVTLYDSGGTMENADEQLFEPSIQVRVRSKTYAEGYNKAAEIRDLLILPTGRIIADWFYIGFWLTSDVVKFGKDAQDRNLFSVNFRLMREPHTTE